MPFHKSIEEIENNLVVLLRENILDDGNNALDTMFEIRKQIKKTYRSGHECVTRAIQCRLVSSEHKKCRETKKTWGVAGLGDDRGGEGGG